MHLGDHRGVDLLQQLQRLVQRGEQRARAADRVGVQRGEVAPGDEGAARALEQHGAHAGVLGNALHSLQHGLGHGQIERVQGLGAVELQGDDGVLARDDEGGCIHGLLSNK